MSPTTGPLALFGETDGYTLDKIRAVLGGQLQSSNGKTYEIEILDRDSQSNPNKSAEIAGNLILNDEVHLLLPASTTDTILPAAEQAELYETPCLSSGAPWQAVVFPRGGGKQTFDWTYHFFWGLDEALNTFVGLWNGARDQQEGRHAVPAEHRRRDLGQRRIRPAGPDQEGGLRGLRAGLFPAAHQ